VSRPLRCCGTTRKVIGEAKDTMSKELGGQGKVILSMKIRSTCYLWFTIVLFTGGMLQTCAIIKFVIKFPTTCGRRPR
jgi:hypothetical protein